MESPLSELGIQQAIALKTAIEHLPFDAFVVSDMERTQHTARVVVPQPATAFVLEPRLREMAKGAREGFPKAMAYEEALNIRQQSVDMKDVPKLESDEEVVYGSAAAVQNVFDSDDHPCWSDSNPLRQVSFRPAAKIG
jgi:probable phosphoglycerate mutase